MRFSVIIPVYNVKAYFDECVNSVLSQSFCDFEVLLVDDGSTDGTESICDEYAEKDSRIRVIHKENGGASSARNCGLDNAEGDFIVFLDSDDYWKDSEALKLLNDSIESFGADVVVFGCTDFNTVTGDEVISRDNYDTELINGSNNEERLHYFLSNRLLPGGPTVFTFKKEITAQSIRFKQGVQDEDYDFVLSVFLNSKCITAVNNPFYMYRKGRLDSVTGLSDIRMIYGIDYTVNKWIEKTNSIENKTVKADVLNYLAYMYCTGLVIIGRMDREQRKKASEIMRRNRFILDYALWRRPKTIKILLKLFSVETLSVILAKYYDLSHI